MTAQLDTVKAPVDEVVQLAELKVCADPSKALVTYALGSCIGVAVWDRRRRVGGLLHLMLPDSTASPGKAKLQPAMFADTGIPLLLKRMLLPGVQRTDLVVKLIGGGSIQVTLPSVDVGARNREAVQAALQRLNLKPAAVDLGGTASRTMRLHVGDGRVVISSGGREYQL